jgi:polysaccharide pyruvyl transferase WcaK-like protein
MCLGSDRLHALYGIETVPLQFRREQALTTPGLRGVVLKSLFRVLDAFRTARWTRRHDVVIVPGMGVLESSLPLRATQLPYALFVLAVSGRLFRTKVALVSVGATAVNQHGIRRLLDATARLSFYCSYRDTASVDAMRRRGVPGGDVYPDLVFALDVPDFGPGARGTVGVGLIAYAGNNDDRRAAQEIYVRYITTMKRFVRWLVDSGYHVRLFWGDDVDVAAVDDVVQDMRCYRPDLDPACLVAEPFATLRDLVSEMGTVGTFVGSRYHNVLAALKCSKPTISLGYSTKHDALMEIMGVPEFSLPVKTVDAAQLIAEFRTLEARAGELRQTLLEQNRQMTEELDQQFKLLSALLFPPDRSEVIDLTADEPAARSNGETRPSTIRG